MASSAVMAEMVREAGVISATPDVHFATVFEWRIPHINTVLQKIGDSCESPPFAFCNAMWTLKLTRNRRSSDIHLNRVAKAPSHEFFIKCTVIKKATNTSVYFTKEGCTTVGSISNILVFCAQKFQWADETDYEVVISCPFECNGCRSVALADPSNSLGEDLLELLISGEESDVTINVKTREFRVHKSIIRARSPVFFSMLKHEMTEKRSGTIDIPDCDPKAFQIFLEYVYSGELKNISKDVVCNVYYIAVKYQVLNGKNLCVKFMSENLSLETFCDISTLAIRHEESELLEKAQKFYVDNMEAITASDRWITFLEEHPVAADDLFKKLKKPKVFHEKKRKLESAASKDESHKELDTVTCDMDDINDALAKAAAMYNERFQQKNV